MAKGLSPVQRTMNSLRGIGSICAVVEHFNPYSGKFGIRQDLFGIIDILVLDPERGVIGIQVCGSSYAQHYRKLTIDNIQDTINWLSTPGTKLEIWAWRKIKIKRGMKAMRWAPRVKELKLAEILEGK